MATLRAAITRMPSTLVIAQGCTYPVPRSTTKTIAWLLILEPTSPLLEVRNHLQECVGRYRLIFRPGYCSGGHGLSIGSVGGRSDNTVDTVNIQSSQIVNSQNGISNYRVAHSSSLTFPRRSYQDSVRCDRIRQRSHLLKHQALRNHQIWHRH